MERELPAVEIEGTLFIVDVLKEELREKSNPENVMDINEMRYAPNNEGYTFLYDPFTKGFPSENKVYVYNYLESLTDVTIPQLVTLDPVGMAERYNIALDDVKGKTDFELMLKPGSPFDLRLNKGMLPTLDIAGQIFYIDLQMEKLRPKDDFKSRGINITEIKEYYDHDKQLYVIPYNPSTHELQPYDITTLTELPKDIITVQFPDLVLLDPVGWVKKLNSSVGEIKQLDFLQMDHAARIVPWEETNVPIHIKRNVAEQLRPTERYVDHKNSHDNLFRIPTDTDRVLPTFHIYGTEFIIDVNRLELREKANPENVISISDMTEVEGPGYEFLYCLSKKGLPSKNDGDCTPVKIPDFVELDPEGMAKKHNLPESSMEVRSDFDLMVDLKAYDKIARLGVLPTIDIAGHTFYIDLARDKLQPKDDIWSRGIIFSELSYYYSYKDQAYTFPYNQKTHSFQEVSLNEKEIPEDLIVIQIPHKDRLNPVWTNQRYGRIKTFGLIKEGPQLHFESKVIPWHQTRFAETIKRNEMRKTKPRQKSSLSSKMQGIETVNKKKSRRI